MPGITSTTRTVAIVGAGCSGVMLASHLLKRHAAGGLRIVLFDKEARMGRGLAYRTWDDNHVLNVPAGNMSVWPDEPQHFVQFCQGIDPAYSASSFVSRRLYGDYLEQVLSAAALGSASILQRVAGEVLAVHPAVDSGGVRLVLADCPQIVVDTVVLATGHLPPVSRVPGVQTAAAGHYVGNPWDAVALDGLRLHDPVLIIGCGHTAVDMLFTLTNQTDRRKVYLLSRRGLLAHAHRPQTSVPVPHEFPAFLRNVPATARQYFHAVRQQIQEAARQGTDWRDIIAPLRPHTPAIWQSLPVVERARFLRHAWTYWDIHRHRLSPTAHRRLHDMIARGQVEVLAGRIRHCQPSADGVALEIAHRQSALVSQLTVKKIISCTGPNYDIAASSHPLLSQLLAAGLIRQDPLRIGLEIAEDYRVIGNEGAPSSSIFYIGPMLRAQFLEGIGVPELRVHAARLARAL